MTNPTDGVADAQERQTDNAKAARTAETAAVDAFWQWWNDGGARALDAMFSAQLFAQPAGGEASGTVGEVPVMDIRAEVGDRIAAIHPELIWGFEPGAPYSRHLMTVSAAGNPETRPAARRWLDAAPDDDETWSFTDLRLADGTIKLGLADIINQLGAGAADLFPATIRNIEIDPADAWVATTTGHGAVDVQLFHPAFAEIVRGAGNGDGAGGGGVSGDGAGMSEADAQALAERVVAQLGFTLLQLSLGEEDFGLWLRGFSFAGIKPEGSIPLPELPGLVDELASKCPEWLTIDAENDGHAVRVVTRAPVTQLVAPTCTQHVVAQLLFADVNEGGLPTDETAQKLNALSEELTAQLGEDGSLIASETSDGVALLHFYIDPVSNAKENIRNLVSAWALGETDVESAHDPGWQRVGHLRV